MASDAVLGVARDLLVAWLTHHQIASESSEDTAAQIGKMYKTVVKNVLESQAL